MLKRVISCQMRGSRSRKKNLKDVSRRKVPSSVKNPPPIPYRKAQELPKAKNLSSGTTDVSRRKVVCSAKILRATPYPKVQELMKGKTAGILQKNTRSPRRSLTPLLDSTPLNKSIGGGNYFGVETKVDGGVEQYISTNGGRSRYSALSSGQRSSRSAQGCDKKTGKMMKTTLKADFEVNKWTTNGNTKEESHVE